MREAGTIKWFGGYNAKKDLDNDFGFISRPGHMADLFVRRSKLRCPEAALKEGTAVTFQVEVNPRNGKEEAVEVRLLADETDPDLISRCAMSTDKALWIPTLAQYLAGLPEDEAAGIMAKRLPAIPASERQRVVSELPRRLLPALLDLRLFLPRDEYLALCANLLSGDPNQAAPRELLEDITPFLPDTDKLDAAFNATLTLREVAYAYRPYPDLRQRLPLAIHITILTEWIASAKLSKERAELIQEIASRFAAHKPRAGTSDDTERRAWDAIPTALLVEPVLWPLVPRDRRLPILVETVEQAWPTLSRNGAGSQWRHMNREAKLLCIFRAAKERQPIQTPPPSEEPDLLARGALALFEAVDAPGKRARAFTLAHTCFQDCIVKEAWRSTDPLDLFPLLPCCRPKVVAYCEGRPWPTEQDKEAGAARASRAFCPRKNDKCELFEISTVDQHHARLWGARLYPERDQSWQDWSLLELLQACGVTPHLEELRNPDEYVTKLAGWVNRLNEIRERLRCSACSQMMVPNYEYSKNLARYNTTVVSCQQGVGHDQDIYLNHCWACRKIIDSRVDRIQKETEEDGKPSRLYLCVACGSGPQRSTTYAQGDMCPKCGIEPMLTHLTADRKQQCRSCSHTIRLPADQYRTGPLCPCDGRMVLVLTRQGSAVRVCTRCGGRGW